MHRVLVLAVACSLAIGCMAAPAEESSEELFDTKEFLNEINESCKNQTGSDEAYQELMMHVSILPLCMARNIDLEKIMNDIDTLDNSTRTAFFQEYCPQVRNALTCLDSPLKTVKKCLEDEDYAFISSMVYILPDAVNLMCKNDGEIFFKFEDVNYLDCVGNFTTFVEDCGSNVTNITESFNVSGFTEKDCTELRDVRGCVQTKLDTCKAPDLIDVFDLFYNAFVRMSSCNQFISLTSKNVELIASNAV